MNILKKILIVLVIIVAVLVAAYYSLIFFVSKNEALLRDFAYEIGLKKISCRECVAHFPSDIPDDMRETMSIHLHTKDDAGSESVVLVLHANENYIRNELSKYKFVDEVTNDRIVTYRTIDLVYLSNAVELKPYKFYLIQDNPQHTKSFGFAVYENDIVYFYSKY